MDTATATATATETQAASAAQKSAVIKSAARKAAKANDSATPAPASERPAAFTLTPGQIKSLDRFAVEAENASADMMVNVLGPLGVEIRNHASFRPEENENDNVAKVASVISKLANARFLMLVGESRAAVLTARLKADYLDYAGYILPAPAVKDLDPQVAKMVKSAYDLLTGHGINPNDTENGGKKLAELFLYHLKRRVSGKLTAAQLEKKIDPRTAAQRKAAQRPSKRPAAGDTVNVPAPAASVTQ